MTSDAKIGLLLGSIFIFIIAFVINGLPHLSRSSGGNDLTTNTNDTGGNLPGLGAQAKKTTRQFPVHIKMPKSPKITPPVKQTVEVKPVQTALYTEAKNTIRYTTEFPAPSKDLLRVSSAVAAQPAPLRPDKVLLKVKPAGRTFHLVCEGDNLSSIAKKFYGDIDGNKYSNVINIYHANKKILKSPDNLRTGQRLIIPLLKNKSAVKTLSDKIFERVSSISPKKENKRSKSKSYTVKDGDSLWLIAAETLGDGNRYTEIVKLNSDILEDEDAIVIGMNLKIPLK